MCTVIYFKDCNIKLDHAEHLSLNLYFVAHRLKSMSKRRLNSKNEYFYLLN